MGRKKVVRYAFKEQGTQEEKLQEALRLFELEGAARVLPEIKKIVEKEKLSFYDGLERLIEEEMSKKEDARIERWIKQAKFPAFKKIEDYDFSHPTSIDKNAILGLMSCDWIKTGGNVIFVGSNGLGKSHLATVLGIKAIENNFETKYIIMKNLADAIAEASEKDRQGEGGNNRKKLLQSFTSVPLIIIDEVASTDSMSDRATGEIFYQIIYDRYEKNLSTILASNKHPSELAPAFGGDETRATAAMDRLMHEGVALNIKGESYRLKKLRERK